MNESTSGYKGFILEIQTLISTYPPSFIYVYDPTSLRTTSKVLTTAITDACNNLDHDAPQIDHIHLDAVTCFTKRLLFDTILSSLPSPDLKPDSPERSSDSWDSFLHHIRHFYSQRRGELRKDIRLVLSIDQAHRLKENLPDSIVPLSRLSELSQIDITVVFVSQTQWQDVKPPLGASPEPYYVDIKPLAKSDVINILSSRFASISQEALASSSKYSHCYDLSLSHLYTHFIAMICEVCFPFVHDIDELAYIAAARWPGFIKPIFSMSGEAQAVAPSEEGRLRLLRFFTPTVKNALESLHPRLTNALDWAAANEPDPNVLDHLPGSYQSPVTKAMIGAGLGIGSTQEDASGTSTLPRMSKFILVASYIASVNPAKTDLRMFGRGLDEKKRRRRNVKSQNKTKGPSKIPQHLLGPSPFPLDRMIAILGALLEENDIDSRLYVPEFTIPGEHTDMEISRVAIFSAIMELVSMHLLFRISQPDRIDGPPTFKSSISQDTALLLAKQLEISLNDLLWETP